MNETKVSVLLPVYNTNPTHLRQCIHSIKDQTLQDFELIISDNGSTDHQTLKVIGQENFDERVKVVHKKQQSGKKNLSCALNEGLKSCSNELVARMDSDDIMHPKRLEKQVNYFNQNWSEVDILGTQLTTSVEELNNGNFKNEKCVHRTNHPEIIPQNYHMSCTWFCNHPTIMFKKSVIFKLGGYREEPDHIPEDFCLWAKAQKNGFKIRNLNEVMLWYREDAVGLSLKDSKRPEWYQAIKESQIKVFDFKRWI